MRRPEGPHRPTLDLDAHVRAHADKSVHHPADFGKGGHVPGHAQRLRGARHWHAIHPLPAMKDAHSIGGGPCSKSDRLSSSSTIWAITRTAERPSLLVQPECAGRPCVVREKRWNAWRPVVTSPRSPLAGSGISTYLWRLASISISSRDVGLPTSSSGLMMNVTGRVSLLASITAFNAARAMTVPPFMS